jgi:hypothetical protein
MIAAAAIEHGYTLVTDHREDFTVPRLTLFAFNQSGSPKHGYIANDVHVIGASHPIE